MVFGYKLGPQNLPNQEESEVNPQEHLPKNPTEKHKIEAVLEGLLDQDHEAKRHKVLICDIQQESLKETLPKLLHENSKKRPRKSKKRGKWEEHKQALRNHVESSMHTMKGSYKV
jgi:hypothetical protein